MDFHTEQNRKAHKTDEYEAENLIIRRGQAFDVTVTFNREFKADIDTVMLQFVTGLLMERLRIAFTANGKSEIAFTFLQKNR